VNTCNRNHKANDPGRCCECRWIFKIQPPRFFCGGCGRPLCLVCEIKQPASSPPAVMPAEPKCGAAIKEDQSVS
jgi:hypothetical protein